MIEGKILSWDEEIMDDSEEFAIIPDGTRCKFTVKKFKRSTSKKGQPMAEMEFTLEDEAGRKGYCRDYVVLVDTQVWKICQFFCSIGRRKHGETAKMDWTKAVGSIGSCTVAVEKYTSDKGESRESNKIKVYHDCLKNKCDAEAEADAKNGKITF